MGVGTTTDTYTKYCSGVLQHYRKGSFDVFLFFFNFPGVCLSKSTVLRNSKIRSHAWIQSSIIGWSSTVGQWVSQLIYGMVI